MLKSAGRSHADSQMVNSHVAHEFTCKLQHQNANSPHCFHTFPTLLVGRICLNIKTFSLQ